MLLLRHLSVRPPNGSWQAGIGSAVVNCAISDNVRGLAAFEPGVTFAFDAERRRSPHSPRMTNAGSRASETSRLREIQTARSCHVRRTGFGRPFRRNALPIGEVRRVWDLSASAIARSASDKRHRRKGAPGIMWRLTGQYRREVIVVFASLMFAWVFVSLSAPTRPHDIPFG